MIVSIIRLRALVHPSVEALRHDPRPGEAREHRPPGAVERAEIDAVLHAAAVAAGQAADHRADRRSRTQTRWPQRARRVPWRILLVRNNDAAENSFRVADRLARARRASSRRAARGITHGHRNTVSSARMNPADAARPRRVEHEAGKLRRRRRSSRRTKATRQGPRDPWQRSLAAPQIGQFLVRTNARRGSGVPPYFGRKPDWRGFRQPKIATSQAEPSFVARGLPNREKIHFFLPGFGHDRGNNASVPARSGTTGSRARGRFQRSNYRRGREISP